MSVKEPTKKEVEKKKLRRNDNDVSRYGKSHQLNWGDGSAGKVLTMQAWGPKLDHVKTADLEVNTPQRWGGRERQLPGACWPGSQG